MKIRFSAESDVGMHRVANEDAFVVDIDEEDGKTRGVFAVADGMGGHRDGERAAQEASRAFMQAIAGGKNPSEAAKAADDAVMAIEGRFSNCSPGSTLTALILTDAGAQIVHVGDSEAFRLTAAGEFEKITRDHASGWGLDNFCGLGANFGGFFADVLGRPVAVGDKFLLATDGLTKHVKAAELEQIMRRVMVKDLAQHLVDLANERGGCDNTTVIAVEVCE
jgi:serine/threonine protein phosphatase PrpC